jgi:hypothetical protein
MSAKSFGTLFERLGRHAASEPKTKCANCRHHEAIIADLQAWVEDLRESRDRWRELALDAERLAAVAESAAAASASS